MFFGGCQSRPAIPGYPSVASIDLDDPAQLRLQVPNGPFLDMTSSGHFLIRNVDPFRIGLFIEEESSMTKLRRFPLIGKCRAQATVQYVCCALRSCKARSILAQNSRHTFLRFTRGAGVCIPRYIGLAFVTTNFVNASAVYRTSTALRKNRKMGADSVGVLGFGKEHHGRDVLYFQMKVDLGSWHSTAELLPLDDQFSYLAQ
jgi:hypothetical protein